MIKTEVRTAKDHGENHVKVKPLLVHYLLCNCTLILIADWYTNCQNVGLFDHASRHSQRIQQTSSALNQADC